MEAGRDTEALYTTDTCTILEVIGRNTGWIAAATGLARRCPVDAPHLIYMPEIPFSYDKLITDVKEVLKAFQKVFIVTAEGLKDHQDNFLTADIGAFGEDTFGHQQLGGVAEVLKAIIEKEIGIKTRFNKLGTNQRSAMHFASLTDVNEAYLCGQSALQGAAQGITGQMVSLIRQKSPHYQCTTGFVDLRDVAQAEKKVPRQYINENANHITDALRNYVKPLVQGQAPISINPDGLPVFMRFKRKPLPKKLSSYFNEK